jgi:hypothetical protein
VSTGLSSKNVFCAACHNISDAVLAQMTKYIFVEFKIIFKSVTSKINILVIPFPGPSDVTSAKQWWMHVTMVIPQWLYIPLKTFTAMFVIQMVQ